MEIETPKKVVTKQTLRSCDCLCCHLLYCFFFYSFVTATLCCLFQNIIFCQNQRFHLMEMLLIFFLFCCCCVSCSIVRPVSLHGCGSPLAHRSHPPHLIIFTCDSPRLLFTPAVPHSLVSSAWFESTSTKTPTFTSLIGQMCLPS